MRTAAGPAPRPAGRLRAERNGETSRERTARSSPRAPTNIAGRAPLTDALRAWWEAAVRPYWPRIRAVLEADIAYRTWRLAEAGIHEVFHRLHPAPRRTGDRLVSADLPAAGLDPGGTGLTLAPSAFAARRHLLAGPGPTPPTAVHPSRTVATLWERHAASGDGLARLLGRGRARLLLTSSSPATTTQLAARCGLGLGAVSQHLPRRATRAFSPATATDARSATRRATSAPPS
ncbi:hypothetical protein ACIQWR_20825 [Streptomyces sp. NPDC098789]|uniref:hypothetical protein n=1 Tax=Streptomyces sp. NPDC098789 TaxID=3366098 RepID=UPI003811BB38